MARREASNLLDLLRIRERNRDKIDAINGNLGSALGFKYTNGQQTNYPSIIVFVPEKIGEELLPEGQVIPKTMEHTEEDGDVLYCKSDVITGGKSDAPDMPPPLDPENRVGTDADGRLADPDLRTRLVEHLMDARAHALTVARIRAESAGDVKVSAAASILKNSATRVAQTKAELRLEILGSHGLGWDGDVLKLGVDPKLLEAAELASAKDPESLAENNLAYEAMKERLDTEQLDEEWVAELIPLETLRSETHDED